MTRRACAFRRRSAPWSGREGITLPETLVVIGISVVIIALLLPILTRAREASREVACIANLRQLGNGFRLYAHEEGQLPYPAFTQVPWERSLAKYVSIPTFRCGSDSELAPVTGSSYDWRDTGVPETTLAGKPWREAQRPDTALAFEALPGWHQPGRLNVTCVDGSTKTMTSDEFGAEMDRPIAGGR